MFVDLIAKKRDGLTLSSSEIRELILSYSRGEVPDYQMAAFLMAVYLNGLSDEETVEMALAMADSGEKVSLNFLGEAVVDKHSTGGVGDKTTLVLLPLVASCGVRVCKMSGRALGHTGGTIDKLEAISGFRTSLSMEDALEQVEKVGIALFEASAEIAPADKKIYALRDATATVDNLSLIAASVMSKKIAGGAKKLVVDLKVGNGAFITEERKAEKLASLILKISEKAGLKTSVALTSMDEPLGWTVGNALEVQEAIETLKGRGERNFVNLCLELAAEVICLAGEANSFEEAKMKAKNQIDNGRALKIFASLIEAQGGDSRVIEDYSLFPEAKIKTDFLAEETGYLHFFDTRKIGQAVKVLGGGRDKKEDQIDHSVGLVFYKKGGEKVEKNDSLLEIRANSYEKLDLADGLIKESLLISPKPIQKDLEIVKKWLRER